MGSRHRADSIAAAISTILVVWVVPAFAVAIPAQAALAGISFMLPVIPVVCLVLVSIYLAVARHLELKGLLARVPGSLFLVLLTIFCFTFFVKFSSSVGGLIDPAAEARLIEFITDNAVQRQEIAGLDRSAKMVLAEPAAIRGTPLTISPANAAREARAGRLLLVDVRPAAEFQGGHLKGAWRFPRYEIEKAVPDYNSQTAVDIYLKSLADHAAADNRVLAFCCSFGVSVSYRTVVELRRGGVPAVMVSGGCSAIQGQGGDFTSGAAVAGDDGFVDPGLLSDWVEAGRVRAVKADLSILADLGAALPSGPIVVVTAGDSPQERALGPLVSAIAQSRGIAVAGHSVSDGVGIGQAPGLLDRTGQALRRAGFFVENVSGLFGPFFLILICSIGVLLSASLIRKSSRSAGGWVGLVLSLVLAAGVFAMIEGTFGAGRIRLFFGSHAWSAPALFAATVLVVYAGMTRPEGRLPRFEATPAPIDGVAAREGRYRWPRVCVSILAGAIVALATPAGALFTLGVLVVLTSAVFIRDAAILLTAHIFKMRLLRAVSDPSDVRSAHIMPADIVRLLSGLAWPLAWFRAAGSSAPVSIVTRVSGRPGMVLLSIDGARIRPVGIMSLAADDGARIPREIETRVGVAVAVAARLGVDLQFDWPARRGFPRVGVPAGFLRDSFFPAGAEDVRDAVMHRQVMAVVAMDDGAIHGGVDRECAILSAERYLEQDPAPTPLTFSVLAARSARRGPAHMTGLMYGFARYFSRTVRLGAGIYEPVGNRSLRSRRSRLRDLVARQYIRALDAVFSDFVLPEALLIAEGIARGRGKSSASTRGIERLLGRLSFFQEATAIAHALIMERCVQAGGDRALDLSGPGPVVARPDPAQEPGSWEFMPRAGACLTDNGLNIDIIRTFGPSYAASGSPADRDIGLLRRVEYFRGAFRQVTGWACGAIGKGVAAAGETGGTGELQFFATMHEIGRHRALLGTGPFAGTLQARRECLESVRPVVLPGVVTVADIEALGSVDAAMEQPVSPTQAEPLHGFLVSGRLPVSGRVKVVRDAHNPGPADGGVISVIAASDPSLVVRLLDCAAVVSESGGRLSHAAMLAREFGLTFVSGVSDASRRLRDGDFITIGTDGVIRMTVSDASAVRDPRGHFGAIALADAGPDCGNKAVALAAMLRDGFNVPPGFVLPSAWMRTAGVEREGFSPAVAAGIWRVLQPLDMGAGFIVRSSAAVEDGRLSSFAGLFKSVSGVSGPVELACAIRDCLDSRDSAGVEALRRRLGIEGGLEFSIILQPVVPAAFSGVAVSRASAADCPDRRGVVVEVQPGRGGVVDGSGSPAAFLVGRDDGFVSAMSDQAMPDGVDTDTIRAVAAAAVRVETLFGCPQDVEWCVCGDRVWIVQARPVAG